MSKFPTVLITIIIASCAVFGCAEPIGTIKGGTGTGKVDDFWTIPRRQYYVHGDDFVRKSDLWAFSSYRGLVESVPVDKLTISLVTNPRAAPAQWEKVDIKNGEYTLVGSVVKTGQKLIVVTYDNKTAEYSIEVRNPDGSVDPGDNGSSGSSVVIQWSPVVKFNSNGGTVVSNQFASKGKAVEPTPPTKSGFAFGGWYEDADLTKPFDFNTSITKDIILYAKWEAP